ncbi:MAG: hypothetical protein PHR98_01960 [Candidatus Shapirobacteria bacterium]|nr:hypothetical protein [Candidatus Shapirobacteria bacterium]
METKFEGNKKKIIEELIKKAPNLECPICHGKNFEFGGGYFAHDLQDDLKNRLIGGINIPTIPLICKGCGYILEFAAGTFGLLPSKEDNKEEGKAEDKTE